MRKSICILLLSVLCILTLSACGGMSDEDALAALHASDEVWISHGLAAWEAGKEPEDLSHIFYDYSSIEYLTLYDHMFIYDEDISIAVAEGFFRFVAEKYGLSAVMDHDKRIEYKTEFLKSLGLDFPYQTQPEGELFFSTVGFHSDSRYDYIFTHNNVSFCLTDMNTLASTSQYRFFIYYTTDFIKKFSDFVKREELEEYFNCDRRIAYHCEELGMGDYSTGRNDGYIILRQFLSAPHEAVHAAANFNADTGANRMLGEGLAEYFTAVSGFSIMDTNANVTACIIAANGDFDSYAASGHESEKRYIALWKAYDAAGGKYDTIEGFDNKLYAHISAAYDRDFGYPDSILQALYRIGIDNPENFEGSELTYAESCSFVTWLIDNYDLKTVLDAWQKDDFSGSFGKDYPTLKSEWQAFLAQYK